jgi:RHS repeat-associated protein
MVESFSGPRQPVPAEAIEIIGERLRAKDDTMMTEIAETNLTLARGLPGSEDLDVPRYLAELDSWTGLVATTTERCLPMFHGAPSQFDGSLAKFRMMALVTVLQRDLGVRYDSACQEASYCALDPRTLFIHGLLDGHGGTCVTMPILYIAIGRRLGYPLYLVQAREHFFVRWEEPAGERFNIEATTLGFTPRDDEHFRHWPKPIREEEIRQGLFLRNLTPGEEVAAFFRERGQCWLDHLRTGQAQRAFAEASRIAPRLLGVQCSWAIASILHRDRHRSRNAASRACSGRTIDHPTINQSRWYDPAVGRWLSPDPSGLGPDANPYRYCGNAPTDGTDATGLGDPLPAVDLSSAEHWAIDVYVTMQSVLAKGGNH